MTKKTAPKETKEEKEQAEHQVKRTECAKEIEQVLAKYEMAISVLPGSLSLVDHPKGVVKSSEDKKE